ESADDCLARAHRVARRAGVRRPGGACRGARAGEVRAGAEPLAGAGEDDGTDIRVLRAPSERVEVALTHVGVHRLPGLGTVHDQPADAVLDPEEEGLALCHAGHTFRLNAFSALSWRNRCFTSGGSSSAPTSGRTRSQRSSG